MNKDNLRRIAETYINTGVWNCSKESLESDSEIDSFLISTVLRLKNAFDLWSADDKYEGDFYIALRDYLLVFDTSINLINIDIASDNKYAINKDYVTGEYYASFQFPNGVVHELAEQGFLRNIREEKKKERSNLLTDSLIYSITGFTHFKSMAQKLAVYGALNTPEGHTTLVSLPTGGGKSLITQTISYRSDGLTIVVIPTVSLADDQVIGAKKTVKSNNVDEEIFAYKSGTDIRPILNAISNKTARMIFISPEALLKNDGFVKEIYKANQQHYLKNIVIDEAHIVMDWGASFRVDFQCLEAWRKELLLTNPMLRTILLSATFEPRCIQVLKSLFSSEDKWIEVRCDSLRREPRYMLIKEKNSADKSKRTIELVQKLPHPMIIYVNRPVEADSVVNMLRKNNINNVKTYTGLTSNKDRERILVEWKNNEFEIMVATSAFGVGVNKPDVRTVLHLYIPQNPNAYYQELGRGGRDGLPCLSVMCVTYPDDLNGAFSRISKRVMTTDKIIMRWSSMFNNPESIRDGNVIHIDTSIRPSYSDKDILDDSPTSDKDVNWNIYVLLLLRRYNLIGIKAVTVDRSRYIISVVVTNDLLLKNEAEQFIEIDRIRSAEWEYYSESFRNMKKAIIQNDTECWSEMFFKTYDLVDEYCGGCNNHFNVEDGEVGFSLKKSINHPQKSIDIEQDSFFEFQNEMVILTDRHSQSQVIRKLEELRMSCLVISENESVELINNLNFGQKCSTLILNTRDISDLTRKKNYYYITGLVVFVYSDIEAEVMSMHSISRKCLNESRNTKIVHIIADNIYLSRLNKHFTDLINGRVIHAKDIM